MAIPLLIKALQGQAIPRPPVWLMRQAGRYMKEYRELKERYSFLELCKIPDLAVEVSLQPIKFLDPDAAIIFSDILIPLETLGFDIDFNPGPIVANPIRTSTDITQIKISSSDTNPTAKSISLLKKELASDKALLGFAGSPWTLACYLIDQGPYKGFLGTKVFANKNPEAMLKLLDLLSDVIADYLLSQISAGADAVQVFDSWGGILSEEEYKTYSLPYLEKIFEKLKSTQTILYTNGGDHLLKQIRTLPVSCISIDWRTSINRAEDLLGNKFAIQGNLDPTKLFKTSNDVAFETSEMLKKLDRKTSYIANLGHGILPGTPPENVKVFVDTVKNFNFA